jgi:hypothetical protein
METTMQPLKLIGIILLVPLMGFGRLFMERRITTPANVRDWILAWQMSDTI